MVSIFCEGRIALWQDLHRNSGLIETACISVETFYTRTMVIPLLKIPQ
jgi:hypothetical protein